MYVCILSLHSYSHSASWRKQPHLLGRTGLYIGWHWSLAMQQSFSAWSPQLFSLSGCQCEVHRWGNKVATCVSVMHVTDIDECVAGTAPCVHICNNTIGSYECSCREGYLLDSNGFNCSGMCVSTHAVWVMLSLRHALLLFLWTQTLMSVGRGCTTVMAMPAALTQKGVSLAHVTVDTGEMELTASVS